MIIPRLYEYLHRFVSRDAKFQQALCLAYYFFFFLSFLISCQVSNHSCQELELFNGLYNVSLKIVIWKLSIIYIHHFCCQTVKYGDQFLSHLWHPKIFCLFCQPKFFVFFAVLAVTTSAFSRSFCILCQHAIINFYIIFSPSQTDQQHENNCSLNEIKL